VTPHLGTVLGFFYSPRLVNAGVKSGGMPCRRLSTIIVLFAILLLHGFIHVKILEGSVNKSASSLYVYTPKVEEYHLQFLARFGRVNINNAYSRLPIRYFYLLTIFNKITNFMRQKR
jgi:hypothetical protein